MYIDKLDKLIDSVIIDFFSFFFKNNSKYKKIINQIKSEVNYVKYQKEINMMISKYQSKIKNINLKNITTNNEYISIIQNILMKYVFYYFFLTIGYFYKGEKDTFINNIIEFSKNQNNYDVEVKGFFNSESNSNIINIYILINNIKDLFKFSKSERENVKDNIKFREAIDILNTIGKNFINNKLLNNKLNENLKCHNIITILIILEIYKKIDQKEINNILSSIDKIKGNYEYIDIVISCKKEYDYSNLENILDEYKFDGIIDSFYNLLLENNNKVYFDSYYKIKKLLNSKLIVPIVDDILLYDNPKESYDKNFSNKFKYRREDTRIKYIVSKIDSVVDFYSESTKSNDKVKKKIYSLFYQPLNDKKAITINSIEDTKILNKLGAVGKNLLDKNEYYNDLKKYDLYSYTNFNNIDKFGFNIILDSTTDVIRYINFENSKFFKRDKNKNVLIRTAFENSPINIVGIILTNKNLYKCLKIKNIINVRNINKKDKNGYKNSLKILSNKILKSNDKKLYYWIFDSEKDMTNIKKYNEINKLKGNNSIMYVISQLYDDIIGLIYDKILNTINKKNNLLINDSFKIVKKIENDFKMKLDRKSEFYKNLEEFIYYEKSVKVKNKIDNNEGLIKGLFGDVKKLIKVDKKKENNKSVLLLNTNNETKKNILVNENETTNAICQHNVTLRNIMNIKKNNLNKFNTDLYEFILKYMIETYDGSFVCKSCGSLLNIKRYVDSGIFKKSTNEYIPFMSDSSYLLKDLEKIPYYDKFRRSISNIDKIVERLASILNIIIYVGNLHSNKISRRNIVKNIIDLIKLQNDNSNKPYNINRSKRITSKYGINLSNLFNFLLNDKIFVFSTKHFDTYKSIKLNNILSYCAILMILNINDTQIINMGGNKTCNYYWFEKYGSILFDGIKININNNNNTKNILDYKVLCYILYFFSCMISKYNLWIIKDNDNVSKRKRIFNTQ